MSEVTALTVIERASLALGTADHEKRLVEMAGRSVAIIGITNPDSYQECHSARMALKNERVKLTGLGKAAREDAQKFSKAVIAEEQRLIAIIQPEEERLGKIEDAHDAIKEAEKQARIKAELDRVETIKARIQGLKDFVPVGHLSSVELLARVALLRDTSINDDGFAEFLEDAVTAKFDSAMALARLLEEAMQREADAAELERLREAEATRAKNAQVAAAAEQRAREEAEAKIAAEQQASRDKIATEEAAARKKIEEEAAAAKAIRDAEEARQRAEQKRLDDDAAALRKEKQRVSDEAAEQERKRLAAERQAEYDLADARALLETFVSKHGSNKEFSGVVRAITAYFDKRKAA